MDPAGYPGDLLVHLRSFATVAGALERGRRGAWLDAARTLGVDVSVLRRRIGVLEAETSVLFEGRGSAARLTREGTRLLATSTTIFRELGRLAEPVAPALSVGCTNTITNEVLPTAVARLRRELPQLRLSIRRTGSTQARTLVDRGELDFAVMRAPAMDASYASVDLGPDRLWLAVPRSHPLAKAKRPSLDAMAKWPLITYRPSSFTRQRVLAELAPRGVSIAVEVDGKSAALRYAELGLGIAFVSLVARERVQRPGLVSIDVTRLFSATRFWLVWRPRDLEPHEQSFVRAVRAAARP
jgi:DNA-binding transcriptional LysR family regulator